MEYVNFDHYWNYTDDGPVLMVVSTDIDEPNELALEPVVTHHQPPNRWADNPDDYYGYTDGHLEVVSPMGVNFPAEAIEEIKYADKHVNYSEFVYEPDGADLLD